MLARALGWAVLMALLALPAGASSGGQAWFDVRDPGVGAKGDGRTDDTLALQGALDRAAGARAEVRVPRGVYLVDCGPARQGQGLCLRSGVTLRLAPGAVIRAMPNALESYAILSVRGASDVAVIGGTLEGDRELHRGRGGEWGMGIHLHRAERVHLKGVTVRHCWGDGFYISGGSRDLLLEGVVADGNRRQGLSIVGAERVTVRNSTFSHTRGTPPEAGLDIEPNAGQHVSDVVISGCSFIGNAGYGLASGTPEKFLLSASVERIRIEGNLFRGNGFNPSRGGVRSAIEISNSRGTCVVDNRIIGNRGRGIYFRHNADDSVCTGNLVQGTQGPPGEGISELACSGNRISSNRLVGNAGPDRVSRRPK